MAALLAYERQAVLEHCVARFGERAEELAQTQSENFQSGV